MKICILTHTFPRFKGDTSAPFMGELARGFQDLGHQVVVLTPFDRQIKKDYPFKVTTFKYIFPDSLHQLGYSRTLAGDRKLKFDAFLLAPFFFFFAFLALLKLVKEEKIDIISAHWIIPNGFLAGLVSRLRGIPYTATIPGSDVYLGTKSALFRLMIKFASLNASYVISDSRYYLKELDSLGIHPRREAIIRYGVNTNKFKPQKKDQQLLKRLGIKKEDLIILAVGRLVEKKGFVYLINAMPQVLQEIPQAKAVIVGEGELGEELKKLVKKLKLDAKVIFAGTISYNDLSKYYNLADIFVMPSIKDETGNIDASPVAMMEAMSTGAAVVATNFSGSADLVSSKTGFLVKEKRPDEIAKSIIKLANIKDRVSFEKDVRKVALENFSTKIIAKKYLTIFEEIVKR